MTALAPTGCAGLEAMRVAVLTRVYPNPAQPTYGVFVRERVRRVAARCAVEVVAPLPWSGVDAMAGRVRRARVPRVEEQGGLTVHHPSVFSVPALGKSLDAVFYALSLWPFLRRLRRRFAFELIDAHFGYPDGVAAVLLGRLLHCPVVLTLRGFEDGLAERSLRRRQVGFAVRRARVVAVSPALARFAADLGAPPDRVQVIPNGIDRRVFHPGDRQVARARLGLSAEGPLLVGVGAFVAHKGHEQILAGLPGLIARHPALRFVAIGNAGGAQSCRRDLRRMVERLRLADHVRLLEARPHAEVAEWLRAADLFCLATRHEGWSNAVGEALACGVPVVSTRVGGNPDRVRDGIDGVLVPSDDAIAFAAAIASALEAKWDRAAIAARAAGRTWERVADEVLETFRAALEDGRRRDGAGGG